jgi:murein tripeptide amidase MpaA
LGGIQIPLITITDFACKQVKKTIVINGRMHPGESSASWVIHGLIRFLLSKSQLARQLRRRAIFKIFPILNIDGVIVGNYRSSFAGVDINRMFGDKTNKLLNPEATMLKSFAKKEGRLAFYFDVHGHSSKKSVFMYGPRFPLHSEHYLKIRILPKLIA